MGWHLIGYNVHSPSNLKRKNMHKRQIAAKKQAKRQGNAKKSITGQPKAKNHAQRSKVRPISKQKGREMLKEHLLSNQMCKSIHNQQTCGQ